MVVSSTVHCGGGEVLVCTVEGALSALSRVFRSVKGVATREQQNREHFLLPAGLFVVQSRAVQNTFCTAQSGGALCTVHCAQCTVHCALAPRGGLAGSEPCLSGGLVNPHWDVRTSRHSVISYFARVYVCPDVSSLYILSSYKNTQIESMLGLSR